MSQADAPSTLNRNAIKQFVLKIDFAELTPEHTSTLIQPLQPLFDRIEKRATKKIALNIKNGATELAEQDAIEYVFTSEKTGLSMTITESGGFISFNTQRYQNRSIYMEVLDATFTILGQLPTPPTIKRIGMRFINMFDCRSPKEISKIYNKRLSMATKAMLENGESTSRAIATEENTEVDFKLRTQYGVINQFHPAPIRTHDLLLDIDVYTDYSLKASKEKVAEIASQLNHAAYKKFISCISDQLLHTLK